MSAPAPAKDPLAYVTARAFLDGYSGRLRERFRGKNARIGRSKTVHGVTYADWLFDEETVLPACGTGFSGESGDRLQPTTEAVNCGNCLKAISRARRAVHWVPGAQQLEMEFRPE